MELTRIPITQINPAPYNPRLDLKPGDPEYERLQRSLDEFGCVEPLVWNKRSGVLVGGHQRLKVLVARGASEVDVSVVDLPPSREKALNLALNKISGGWDEDKLARLLDDILATSEQAFELTGFSLDEAQRLIDDVLGPPDEDLFEIDDKHLGDPITQPGELLELGPHRVLCSDSTETGDVAQLMNGERAILMATDPPYLVDYDGDTAHLRGRWDVYAGDDAGLALYRGFVTTALEHALGDRPAVYQWHASKRTPLVVQAWIEAGLLAHQTIVWVKTAGVPGHAHFMQQYEPCLYGWPTGRMPERRPPRDATNVWEIAHRGELEGHHPTQKPLELFERPMRWHTEPGDICYEPFAGSGSQLIAADRLGRRCFAMEREPRYCDVIVRRYLRRAGVDHPLRERYTEVLR